LKNRKINERRRVSCYDINRNKAQEHVETGEDYCSDIIRDSSARIPENTSNILDILDTYTTLELIEDLREDLRNYPEILVQIFKERVKRYSHQKLSLLWHNGKNRGYVSNQLWKFKKNRVFTITNEDLIKLEDNLKKRFNNRVSKYSQIIQKYKNSELPLDLFIKLLEKELGRISTDVKVTYGELSIILLGRKGSVYDIRERITNSTYEDYNPNYKFARSTLKEFRRILNRILKEHAKTCIKFIDNYERLNPNLKNYPKQQYTIKKPRIFKNPSLFVVIAYWFGFLCADAYLHPRRKQFHFELQRSDRKVLVKFAEFVGLEKDRIVNRIRILRDKNGNLKKYPMSYIQFVCKSMGQDLIKNGFLDFKSEGKVPNFVLSSIKKALRDKSHRLSEIFEGRIALAFLLGFYDLLQKERG